MSGLDYYHLLEKTEGDLSKATPEEMGVAARHNPNDPVSARRLAEKKYQEEYKMTTCCRCGRRYSIKKEWACCQYDR